MTHVCFLSQKNNSLGSRSKLMLYIVKCMTDILKSFQQMAVLKVHIPH